MSICTQTLLFFVNIFIMVWKKSWFPNKIFKQTRTLIVRPKAKHYVDNDQALAYGHTPDSPTGFSIDLGDGALATKRPETRDIGVNTDSEDTQSKPNTVSIDEHNAAIDSLAHSTEQEYQARTKAENEIQQLNSKLKAMQTKWKRTANQLDQMLSQSQGFNKVTDEEFKDMALQLQYNIRNFAIQYFSDPAKGSGIQVRSFLLNHMPKDFKLYLKSRENCPAIIQAFIWKMLTVFIFNKFLWAGCASRGFSQLWQQLNFERTGDQKLHMWRATTATLTSQSMTEKDLSHNQQTKDRVLHDILEITKALSDQAYDSEVSSIIDDAIKLDKIISLQVAGVSWNFQDDRDEIHAKTRHAPDMGSMVVVFPAMLKRGKSNGEDFDVEYVLLPRIKELCVVEGARKEQKG
ncbi:uncharacterized protein GGS22DRAFT_168313 [Annulohypoxylon maeteangense]|uniref:uncharacterized protein n=1 Tax=Annulohypoxylon maeteangense TaxID=1927788 RepID=UPI00200782AE|nr:uncharacterized protein GGS22DRAFT_168313 [Annulohypoxylon maeteangense]KAI0883272.1 hypothetical protein GGS22DRAFT_168313 [Annulohypoxylon maeteangense]